MPPVQAVMAGISIILCRSTSLSNTCTTGSSARLLTRAKLYTRQRVSECSEVQAGITQRPSSSCAHIHTHTIVTGSASETFGVLGVYSARLDKIKFTVGDVWDVVFLLGAPCLYERVVC